jgi:transcriptional regulator
VSDAPRSFIDKLMGVIVGIELPIERLEGKLKVSQDEANQDRRGTVQGLRNKPGDEAEAVADLVGKAMEADAARRS